MGKFGEKNTFNLKTGDFQSEQDFQPTPQTDQSERISCFQTFLPFNPENFKEEVPELLCNKHTNDLKTIVVFFKSWLQQKGMSRQLKMFKTIKKLENNSIKSMNRQSFKQLCQLPGMREVMIQSLLEFKPSCKLSLKKQAHYRCGALKVLLRLINQRLQSVQIE